MRYATYMQAQSCLSARRRRFRELKTRRRARPRETSQSLLRDWQTTRRCGRTRWDRLQVPLYDIEVFRDAGHEPSESAQGLR